MKSSKNKKVAARKAAAAARANAAKQAAAPAAKTEPVKETPAKAEPAKEAAPTAPAAKTETQPALKAAPVQEKLNAAPTQEKLKAAPVQEKLKAAPVQEKLKAAPKQEKLKAAPTPEKLKAAPKKEALKAAPAQSSAEDDAAFERRLARHYDELKWLYCELYHGDVQAFDYCVSMLHKAWADRKPALRAQDAAREADPNWYRRQDLLGMMMYTNAFAGTLKGVEEKLPYIQECGVNYLHLMPLLQSPKGRSDGGYAVADFRTVQPELGTMDDLEHLADACREKGMSLCLDFVMNHTSEDHEWARKARAGEPGYRDRYFFYDNWDIPNEFEKTVPQVFPTTAPGSFTWLDDCQQVVMTNFYPYQWDLNYANPVVFNDMTENLLYLTNRGIDVIRLDAVPYIWKELGTTCRNLPQVHTLVRMMRMVCEIVCPSVLLLGEVVMEPAKVVPYFGTPEKPECHMLYNVTTMASTWHTLATADVSLLRHQMDTICALQIF